MKIIVNGACGRMGAELIKQIDSSDMHELVCGADIRADGTDARIVKELPQSACADVIIDFSHHSCVGELLGYAEKNAIPAVIATTGHTEEEKARIISAAKRIPVFYSANMSLGIAVLSDFARRAAELFPDAEIEIVETHHDRKLDSPSGTALLLAERIKEVRPKAAFVCGRSGQGKRSFDEIGIHSLRLGNVVGEHTVILDNGQESITLTHKAQSRSLFASGALKAAEFLAKRERGLYDMRSLVE